MDPDRKADRTKDWRELCAEAATELDPVKLMNLIAELTRALNERKQNGKGNGGEDMRSGSAISLHRRDYGLNEFSLAEIVSR